MTEHVTGDLRVDSGQLAGRAYRPLQCVFKNVVAAPQFGIIIPNGLRIPLGSLRRFIGKN